MWLAYTPSRPGLRPARMISFAYVLELAPMSRTQALTSLAAVLLLPFPCCRHLLLCRHVQPLPKAFA
jgi:hypothetical protein